MAKHTINRQQLVLEFVSVVFAVLLALFLNAWREDAASQKQLLRVKESIRTEIEKNDLEVKKSYDYRLKLVQDMSRREHMVSFMRVDQIPVDIANDQALERFLKNSLTFSSSRNYQEIAIKSSGDQRILVLDKHVFQVRVENDTLKLFGAGGIQLRTAGISNRFWEKAQATGTVGYMDLELVDAIINVHNLNLHYLSTADDAIEMIYNGEPGVLSVLQDMVYFESEIIKADSVLLELL